MTTLRVGQATDVGLIRQQNEDNLLVAEPLFAVADGMGGHAAGEVASLAAVEALRSAFHANEPSMAALREGVRQANRAVWDRAVDDDSLTGMGTTMAAAALVGSGDNEVMAIANVGDSRVYLLRDGELSQITEDHSLVQDYVRSGQLTAAEAANHPQRNILTRVLGQAPDVEVDTFEVTPLRGDRFLLASDGLFGEVADETTASVLRRFEDPTDAAKELVRLARAHGGGDNITVVLVDVVDDGDRSGRASAVLAAEPPRTTEGRAGLLTSAARDAQLRELDSDAAPAPASTAVNPLAPDGSWTGRAEEVREPSRITFRVVAFVVVILLIAGAGLAATAWYARNAFYVGLDDERIAIYKGRPGGVLWFKPTLVEHTRLTTDDVAPSRLLQLRDGKVEPSLLEARRYAGRLAEEAASLEIPDSFEEDDEDLTGGSTSTSVVTVPPPPTSTP